ncbi:MAG: DUF2203 domain-containing protein [Ardenticatenaceae bacterium]|nr:DUF2203 domain-containing protein [Ardenticatenaceae bacterium]MCB8947013.1 DUF2203 domain-containing protein [Ardenticatenaceae bacterium]
MMKYFTVEEANALLPKLKPLMKQLLNRRARASRLAQQQGHLLGDYRSNVGSADLSTLTQDFVAIDRLIAHIQAYGVLIKDVNGGLLDFLSERNGRDVYLCWKYGEDKIEFYHELHTGFAGRQQV